MAMNRQVMGLVAWLSGGVVLAAACGGGSTAPVGRASSSPAAVVAGEPYRADIDPANFVETIDNPYLPFTPGTTLVYHGKSEGDRETNKVTTTHDTKEILGVTTTVVHDQVFTGAELTEDTFDWFAQDRFGNVWYFGEDTKELEDGKVVSREGSWEAGVDGAQPGIVMLGRPRVGGWYWQEFARGEAEDQGRVVRLGESVTVPYDSFDDVLVTEDRTPLEPKVLENKFYARGIGVVFERLVRGGKEVLELVDVRGA